MEIKQAEDLCEEGYFHPQKLQEGGRKEDEENLNKNKRKRTSPCFLVLAPVSSFYSPHTAKEQAPDHVSVLEESRKA